MQLRVIIPQFPFRYICFSLSAYRFTKHTWHATGIKYFEQLYDYRVNKFYSFNEINRLYGIQNNDFLKYIALIHCIPTSYKNKIESENINSPNNPKLVDELKQSKYQNKILCSLQLNKPVNPLAEIKWKQLFPNFDNKKKGIYQQIYKTTIDTSLRSFQYKFILRIIPTNKYLFIHLIYVPYAA